MMPKMNLMPFTVAKTRSEVVLFAGLLLFLCIMVLVVAIGIAMSVIGIYALAITIGACAMVLILLLRQDELAAIFILVLHLYVDWYLGLLVIAPALAGVLLLIFYLTRSPQHPWTTPRVLWLWSAFLLLSIYPAMRGLSLSRNDAAFYYPNIMVGALLMFWQGTVLARDIACARRFFKMLAVVGTCLAIITIIQDKTGILLFGTSRYDPSIASTANFSLLWGGDVYRLGSLFVNPDWNGAFFATMFCIPLGLFVDSNRPWEKVLYLGEVCIILPALLLTYSVGAWLSMGISVAVFVVLVGRMRYRAGVILFSFVLITLLFIFSPDQLALLQQHGTDPAVFSLRNGAWATAINIVQAFPLTGIGLGLHLYLQQAEPYRVPQQYMPLAHPHNSYLELGAMAGLPVIVLFIALLLFSLWLALRNWMLTDVRQRALLSGSIAAIVALSINSLSVNAWTFPPLAAFGWLILGIVSSPLLAKRLENKKQIITERSNEEETATKYE
jgi:O-antigen ligase